MGAANRDSKEKEKEKEREKERYLHTVSRQL